MTQLDPKYVASSHPVNRRKVRRREPLPPAPVNPVVQQRLAAAQARNRLGPPLVDQVRSIAASPANRLLRPLAVVGGVTATASGVALFLAWLQASPWLAAAGAVGSLGGWLVARRAMRSPVRADFAPAAAPLFDEACLHALDRAIDQMAAEVPDAIATQLVEFKQSIVRIARQSGTATVDENFTVEDRLYVNECVRRYLPDTLQSFLAVPPERRASKMLKGESAADLLASQLALLRTELEAREARMARSAAEQLLRQQRFLKAKAGR